MVLFLKGLIPAFVFLFPTIFSSSRACPQKHMHTSLWYAPPFILTKTRIIPRTMLSLSLSAQWLNLLIAGRFFKKI